MSNDALQNPGQVPDGLRKLSDVTPLHAGSAQYFRLARSVWQPALESLHAIGVRFVDVAIPWNVHETRAGRFDFGEDNPRLDVVAFLGLAASIGLRAIVRFGPLLSAGLPFGGIPERVVWDEACMSRTRTGAPRLEAALPAAYPLPSHASRAFHDQAAAFLRAAAERVARLAAPGGPLACAIVGDEHRPTALPAGASHGDHHPDAIAQYRRFLKHRYRNIAALRRIHGPDATFDGVEPPTDDARSDPDALGAQLDWLEAQEAIVEGAFYRYRSVLDKHGLRDVTKVYELTGSRSQVAVDPLRMARVAGGVSYELRGEASVEGVRAIAACMSRAAAGAGQRNDPVFVSKAYAGFAADASPRSDADDLFVAMTALAYGARGIGLHEGVQRDRWIGGPVDAHGRARRSAEPWRRLLAALDRTRHATLVRLAPVRIAVPRSVERLDLLTSATAPFAASVACSKPFDAALEGEADPTRGALAEAHAFVTALERALERERVPYAVVAAEAIERSLGDALWTIVACPGALDGVLTSAIAQHVLVGKAVSVGPRAPERDGHFLPTSARLPAVQHPKVPLVLPRGPSTLSELVRTALADLDVPRLAAEPSVVRTTLHVDSYGKPRSLFVINPSEQSVDARVSAPRFSRARDAISGETVATQDGTAALPVPPRTVRILALDSDS
jgi:beta-galactosidase